MQNPIYFDSHMHTPYVQGWEPFEYAESGKKEIKDHYDLSFTYAERILQTLE